MKKYPSLLWVRRQLRTNFTSRIKDKVLNAVIVGSEAKGTATGQSDLDIAIVLKSKPRVSSLKLTERYHSKFLVDEQKPIWNGRIVDFQFFYEDDSVLQSYSQIQLEKK